MKIKNFMAGRGRLSHGCTGWMHAPLHLPTSRVVSLLLYHHGLDWGLGQGYPPATPEVGTPHEGGLGGEVRVMGMAR